MMRSLKRMAVLVVAAGALMLVFGVGSAFAKPCWSRLIDDWYDGRIDNYYPYSCVRAALRNAPEDLSTYSDLRSDLTRMLAQPQTGPGQKQWVAPNEEGRNRGPRYDRTTSSVGTSSKKDKNTVGAAAPGNGRNPPNGPIPNAIDSLGPNDASSVPIPLLALGALALLLLASGATGLFTRRIRARRAGPEPPAPDA